MKLRYGAALFFLTACFCGTVHAQEKTSRIGAADLKRHIIRAQASSSQTRDHRPEFAFDDNRQTRWSSEFEDEQWLICEFDQVVSLSRIRIYWELARAFGYSIDRYDAGQWVEVAKRTEESDEIDSIDFFRPVRTSRLRFRFHERATKWGYSIFEISCFGSAPRPAAGINLVGWELPPSQWQLRERKFSQLMLKTANQDPQSAVDLSDEEFLDLVERRAFDYFWWETNPTNGLTKDRARNFGSSEEVSHASVAACGFALSAYVIGVYRGWTIKENALERTINTLSTFRDGYVRNVHGFFPHFVSYFSGKDTMATEISTIDTALFLAGMITAKEFFQDPVVDELTSDIFERVNWIWAKNGHKHFVTHGVDSSGNALGSHWGSWTEGILIYLLGIGSPSYPLSEDSWYAITRGRGDYAGYHYLTEGSFQTTYPFQYPMLWFDFRNYVDQTGTDYDESTIQATLAMRAYCMDLAKQFPKSYTPTQWGLGPADGPGDRYYIYGFPPGNPYSPADGTFIIHTIGGATHILPRHAIQSLRHVYDTFRNSWGKYGFTDSLNPSTGFRSRDVIGIDVGTTLLSIENHRSGLIWQLFMQNEWIKNGMAKMGWKERAPANAPSSPIDLARNSTWKFRASDGNFSSLRFDDSSWPVVAIPDRWEYYAPSLRDHDGVGWYRTTFHLDQQRLSAWRTARRPVYLHIGAIDDADQAFLNGTRIGQTMPSRGSYSKERKYVIPLLLLREGENAIAIRVHDKGGAGGIWNGPIQIGPLELSAAR